VTVLSDGSTVRSRYVPTKRADCASGLVSMCMFVVKEIEVGVGGEGIPTGVLRTLVMHIIIYMYTIIYALTTFKSSLVSLVWHLLSQIQLHT